MKKLNLLFSLLLILSICSCSSKDDDSTEDLPDYSGTYTLTSIVPNLGLDPDVSGDFSETEILDKLDCTSTIILNDDSNFNWDYVNLSQIVNNIMDVVTYMPLECIIFSGSVGDYEVLGTTISFAFDASLSDLNAIIDQNTITVTLNEELAVENGGVVQLGTVQLTLTYDK